MSNLHQPDCVMLNAADAAYTILTDTTWSAPPPADLPDTMFYNAVPWTKNKPPVAIVGGEENTDACLVGTVDLPDNGGPAAVVAFRGTLPFSDPGEYAAKFYDWVINDLLTIAPIDEPKLGAGVTVHRGWWNSVNAIWELVRNQLTTLYKDGGDMPLYFTGHSKGGPMASLGAARLWMDHQQGSATNVPLPSVITFASPHPGNTKFKDFYNGVITTSRRWEYAYDIVPIAPLTQADIVAFRLWLEKHSTLSHFEKMLLDAFLALMFTWDYAAVGKVEYIDAAGNHNPIDNPEAIRLVTDILPNVEANGLAALAAAHCHACHSKGVNCPSKDCKCDGGYQSGTCGTTVCIS